MPNKKKSPKAKLPKAIAGVKIGKELRNAVEPVLRFAGNPMVSDALAAALIAGADSLVGGKKGGKGPAPVAGAAASGAKKGHTIELMLAVAAGEIASQIIAGFEGEGRRQPAKGRRSSPAKGRRGSAARPK